MIWLRNLIPMIPMIPMTPSSFLTATLLALSLSSCHHGVLCSPCSLPPTQTATYLIEYTWGLTSATSIHSLSSGTLHDYRGMPRDSLHFLWGLDPNLSIDAVCSFILDNGDSTISNIVYIGAAAGVPNSDTSTFAFDTIVTATPWRPTYSDTLFITKISPTTLVFQVSYADSAGTGVEADSFRNVGFYRPF
jgi:hypothetical protein